LDTLLSVEQAAERLGTSVRFVRRLIAERRIAYVKAGMYVWTRPMWRRSSPLAGSRSDHRQWPRSPIDAVALAMLRWLLVGW